MISIIKSSIKEFKRFSNDSNVLIYQMGKVGSTALESAIPSNIHLHTLYIDNYPCKPRLHGIWGTGWFYYVRKLRHRWLFFLRRFAIKQRKVVKIITLVRNPMDRNISMFFQDLDAYVFNNFTRLDKTSLPKSTRLDDAVLLQTLFETQFEHDYPLTWFDKEFKRFLGVDLYRHQFDIEGGYGLIKHNNIEILCLDVAKMSSNTVLLNEFLGQEIVFNNVNVGSNKWYADLYKQFKKDYIPSADIQKKIQSSKFYKHFFESEN